MKRYEIYVDAVNDIYEALGCAEAYEAQFIYDTHTHEIIWGKE